MSDAETIEQAEPASDRDAREPVDTTGPVERAAGRDRPTPDPDLHEAPPKPRRGKTVHGEAANAGHRVLAPDDAEVEAYLETALKAPGPERSPQDRPGAGLPSGSPATAEPDTVVVLDFGSQFAQLIARRVRELNVYSELLPHDTPWSEIERRHPRAIILSGGPNSVYDEDAPRPDATIWSGRIPVLGICYGAQLMAHRAGRRRPARDQARVRPGDGDDHRGRRPVRRSRPRPAGLDEPRRLDHPAARGLPSDRPDRLDAVRRPGRPGPQACTGSSSTPRSSTRRAAATSCATSSSGSPAPGRPGRRPTSSSRRSPRSGRGSTPTPARSARTGWSSAP